MDSKTLNIILIIVVSAAVAVLLYKYLYPCNCMLPIIPVKESYEDEYFDFGGLFKDAMNVGKAALPHAVKFGKAVAPHVPGAIKAGSHIIGGAAAAKRDCGKDVECWMSRMVPNY